MATWVSWVDATSNSSTAMTTSSGATVWTCWNNGYATTASTNTSDTWTIWATSGTVLTVSHQPARQLTAEEIEQNRIATEERNRQYQEAEAKRKQEREAADAKAKELLVVFLTPSQRQALETMHAIALESITGKKYRIRKGWAGNIDELDDKGEVVATLCVHPNEAVPEYDNMLAQMLMIQTDEARLLRTANRTPRR
jgi:hypothetical protein